MNQFPSIKRYTRIDGDGHGENLEATRTHAWKTGPHLGLGSSSSDYELREQKIQPQSSRAPFTIEMPPLSPQQKYSAVNLHQDDDNLSRSLQSDHIGAGKVNTGYNPFFLRRWVLVSFALLWALIIISLQIIYSVSHARRGLATTDESLRYLWTYGPTAILVVITVVWRQVDYTTKYVQPWSELARGPSPADRTLLLDYITPLQFVAFWRALRLKHATVASTVLIFVLIKVLTVISTGILNLELVPFEGVAQTMRALTEIDGSQGLPSETIDSRAAVGLYGARTYNMLLPNGTTENLAFQIFEPSNSVPSDTYAYNASVDVFSADGWDCQVGQLSYTNASDHEDVGDGTGLFENTPVMSYYNTTIKLPDCEIHNGHLDAPDWYWVANDTVPRYGYWGIFQNVNCSNLDDKDPKKQRYIISVAYSRGIGQKNNIVLNTSNVVCTPSYSVQSAFVNIFANGSLASNITLTGAKRQINGISGDDIARAAYTTAVQANIPSEINSSNVTSDAFLTNMIALTSNFQFEMLLDNNWLETKSREAYQQYAAQIAGLFLFKPTTNSKTFDGTISRNELRLLVRELPTRLMQATAGVMLVLTCIVLLTVPQNVVPRSVESVAAIAVILARSPSLVQIMRHTGHLNMQQLKQVLQGHRYMSTVADAPHGKTFSIRVITGSDTTKAPPTDDHINWTQPIVLRRAIMILTLAFAVGVLIALETLYRYSEAHSGIADVNSASLQKYAWLYTPTVVLVFLATTFNVLDFELEFADPYHELARGYTSATKSMFWDPLRNIAPKTCLDAIRHSRYALVASSISVLFAPILTIAVSGLFIAQAVPHTQSITLTAETWFNISADYNANSITSQKFAIPALILQGNMTYPQWTFEELAFPSVDLSSISTGIQNITGGSFNIELPAVRGFVNCTSIPQSLYYNLTVGEGSFVCDNCVNWNISQPKGCGSSTNAQGVVSQTGYVDFSSSGTGYFGQVDYGFGLVTNSTTGELIQSCPSYYVIYGKVENREIKNWALLQCYTGFETVQTNSTIDANLATIVDTPFPPIVEPNSAKVFEQYWKPDGGSFTGGPYFAPINFTHPDENFDSYFNVMIYGKDGIPRDELLKSNDTLITQWSHVYRQWAAQWLSSYMRQPVAELSKNATNVAGEAASLPRTLPAVFSDPNRQRLFLSSVSTRILEGVIGVLLICGMVIVIIVDMSKVLPKPVGTIGAVASLLAGSRLVDEKSGLIPHGAEWLSDVEMKRRGMWAGEMFRMGWWKNEDDSWSDLDTGYRGAGPGGELDDTLAKNMGDFRIDSRPQVDASGHGT